MIEKTRKTDYCVIAKEADENGWHDLQTNSAWNANPYGEAYATVPDDMVQDIIRTFGYCDIELNEDGTEIIKFIATEIPANETVTIEPTQLDIIEAQVTYTAMMTDTLLKEV